MNKIYKYLVFALLLMASLTVRAQQEPMISQYMFNGLLLNPAYAGSNGYINSTLMHRRQWAGLPGAPLTQIASVHGLLADKKNALGAIISNDNIGVTNTTDFYGNYAYHIELDKDHTLALGLRGGFSWYNVNLSKLTVWDEGDPLYEQDKVSAVLPNVGTGAYLFSDRYYVGLSVPNILSYDPSKIFSADLASIPFKKRHFYGTAGYAFVPNDNFVIKPSFLFKYVQNAPAELDLNLNFLLREKVWLGASYRTGDSVLGMLGILLSKHLQLGYAYDYTISKLADYNHGTHEIVVTYNFGESVIRMKTPRYF